MLGLYAYQGFQQCKKNSTQTRQGMHPFSPRIPLPRAPRAPAGSSDTAARELPSTPAGTCASRPPADFRRRVWLQSGPSTAHSQAQSTPSASRQGCPTQPAPACRMAATTRAAAQEFKSSGATSRPPRDSPDKVPLLSITLPACPRGAEARVPAAAFMTAARRKPAARPCARAVRPPHCARPAHLAGLMKPPSPSHPTRGLCAPRLCKGCR